MKIYFNEINDFGKNVNEHIEKTKTEQNERKKKLFSEWKERKSSLPIFTLNLNRNKNENEEDNIDNKENGIITAREKKDKMKLFGYDIKNKRQPGINEKLKNERMLLIRSLDNPKLAVKSSHKILFQKYKKFTDNINNESNKKNIIVKEKENNSLSHKRSKKRLFPLQPKPNIKIDYLTEMIAQNGEKEEIGNNLEDFDIFEDRKSVV